MNQKTLASTSRILAVFLVLALLFAAAPRHVSAADGLSLRIIAVDQDNQIVIEAVNFPKNQTWTLRIGSYYNFRKDAVVVDTISSTNGGTFRFIAKLPSVVHGQEWISVRMDSNQKYYAYNAFFNIDRGDATTTGEQPSATTATPTPAASNLACSVLSVSVNTRTSMTPYYDFDAVWEVKNTGSKDWETGTIDYKYMSGTKLHIYNDVYDLPKLVKPNETVSIRVDMKAPALAGIYSSTWALVDGSRVVCYLPVSISVR